MKNLIFVIVLFFSSLQLFAQNNEMTIYVANKYGECKTVSIGNVQCFLIKETKTSEWQNFNGKIEGFKYIQGYEYELVVDKINADNPPTDMSKFNYKLKYIVDKKASMVITKSNRQRLDGKTFILDKIRVKGRLITPKEKDVKLSFKLDDNSVSGSDGCNTYLGNVEINKNEITFGSLGATKMFCVNCETDKVFYTLISEVNKYKIYGYTLKLYKGKKILFQYSVEK
jgi:heat shock protein HslJ